MNEEKGIFKIMKKLELKQLIKEVIHNYPKSISDWKSFYDDTKSDTIDLNDYEKKWGDVDFPHITDALRKTKNFKEFIKFIKPFEKSLK
jgi:hypothetical protein